MCRRITDADIMASLVWNNTYSTGTLWFYVLTYILKFCFIISYCLPFTFVLALLFWLIVLLTRNKRMMMMMIMIMRARYPGNRHTSTSLLSGYLHRFQGFLHRFVHVFCKMLLLNWTSLAHSQTQSQHGEYRLLIPTMAHHHYGSQ